MFYLIDFRIKGIIMTVIPEGSNLVICQDDL